jgi:hypothetical protein
MGNLFKSMGHGFLYLYGMNIFSIIILVIVGAILNRFFHHQKKP